MCACVCIDVYGYRDYSIIITVPGLLHFEPQCRNIISVLSEYPITVIVSGDNCISANKVKSTFNNSPAGYIPNDLL